MKSDRFLSSCIKVEEKRVSRHASIPSQVYFELNSDIVARINEINAEHGSLHLEPQQLTNLRYYSLINSPLAKSDRLSLVFSSNYSFSGDRVPIAVVRSTIDISGKIAQEIRQDLWQDVCLSSQVIQAHHWLTAEILRQLPLESKNRTNLIFWALWLTSASAFILIVWFLLPLLFWLKVITILAFLLVSKLLLKYLIKYRLKQWIINRLTYGWLGNKTNKRQLGFKLLSMFNNNSNLKRRIKN